MLEIRFAQNLYFVHNKLRYIAPWCGNEYDDDDDEGHVRGNFTTLNVHGTRAAFVDDRIP